MCPYPRSREPQADVFMIGFCPQEVEHEQRDEVPRVQPESQDAPAPIPSSETRVLETTELLEAILKYVRLSRSPIGTSR